jgi:hypothetical protein
MFLFEQMFNTALSGIASAGLMSLVLTTAYGILLASLLFSAYESWVRGGDVRSLGIAAIKYLAIGMLFLNNGTVYQSVFQGLVAAFNSLAHNMAGVGPGDVFAAWISELRNAASGSTTVLNWVTGLTAGVLSSLLLLVAMIVYPVSYLIFAILYSLFGAILYVTGPLVLALLPSIGIGSLARRYVVNLFVFASWGLIYGIFCRLADGVQHQQHGGDYECRQLRGSLNQCFRGSAPGGGEHSLFRLHSADSDAGEADCRGRCRQQHVDGARHGSRAGAGNDVPCRRSRGRVRRHVIGWRREGKGASDGGGGGSSNLRPRPSLASSARQALAESGVGACGGSRAERAVGWGKRHGATTARRTFLMQLAGWPARLAALGVQGGTAGRTGGKNLAIR